MRYSVVILMCLALLACGKTGALYLPEEEPESQPAEAPAQSQDSDTGSSEKAD